MDEDLKEIFGKVTEVYDAEVKIGSRCQSRYFYRVEDIKDSELATIAEYLEDRIENVCNPNYPELLVCMPNTSQGFLVELIKQMSHRGHEVDVIDYNTLIESPAKTAALRNKPVVLVNDVITTARSCLEAHSFLTIARAQVLCWLALVDRTFGPGPVPVIASFAGRPVTLL